MYLQLIGDNNKPIVINTEYIVRMISDKDQPLTHSYLVLVKEGNFKVKHPIDELIAVMDVKKPFLDKIEQIMQEQAVMGVASTRMSASTPAEISVSTLSQARDRIMTHYRSNPRSCVVDPREFVASTPEPELEPFPETSDQVRF